MFILAIVLGSCLDTFMFFKDIKGICAEAITEVDEIDTEDYNSVAITVLPKSLNNETY